MITLQNFVKNMSLALLVPSLTFPIRFPKLPSPLTASMLPKPAKSVTVRLLSMFRLLREPNYIKI